MTLLSELRAAFKPYDYLLTAAIAAGRTEFERAYNITALNLYLDFLNLMTYDYHGAYDNNTAHNSPLYPDVLNQSKHDQELTIDYTVNYFLRNGTDPKKIILGIPLYGHVYRLASPGNHRVGAPVNGTGREQRGYNKVCWYVYVTDSLSLFFFFQFSYVYNSNNQTGTYIGITLLRFHML